MASFITRLLSRFKNQKRSQRSRRDRNRKLRVENMEARNLMAGDLGAITGNVFTDLTDNGFDVSDTALVGTTLHLYRDGGDNTLNSTGGVAGGDDAFVGTVTTNGTGIYNFSDLTAGRYFIQQAAVVGRLQRTTEMVKEVVLADITSYDDSLPVGTNDPLPVGADARSTGVTTLKIDTYNVTPTSPDPLTAISGTTVSAQVNTAVGETLGGQRDIVVNNTSGANDIDVRVNAGVLSINAGTGTSGSVIVSYDGIDASATTLDHATLGLTDLTANGGTAFHFVAGSEVGNTLTIDVYSGGTNFSSTTIPLPVTVGGVATEDLYVRFADINTNTGSGANFAAVTAIRFQVNVAAGIDSEINFTRVVGPDTATRNFANLNPMSLGNTVFNDANNNGVQDIGEGGISGVLVQLFEDTNLNGSYDVGVDQPVGVSDTTDVSGNYLFTDLFPGEYIALIPISQFGVGAPLEGHLSSNDPTAAPDPDIAVVDGDDNGTLIAGVGVASFAITLASGTEPTNDGDNDPNSNLTLDFGFAPEIDLSVVKTANVTSVPAGNQITYTLIVRNDGAGTSTNVRVVDNLPNLAPDDLTIISATSTGGGVVTQTGNATGEIEVAFASLAPSQQETITIVVAVPASAVAAAAITNTATITGDGIETNLNNNSSPVDVEITRQSVLTISKTDTPDPNSVGGTLTYEILVTNTGPSTANNVVISDSLPSGLTFDSVSTTAGTATEVGGVITANIPTLAVGAEVTVTVVTTIQASFAGSTIPNTATARADDAALVTANATTTVNPQVDLALTKTDSVDPVNRGAQLVYTLVATNNGPSGATNVEVVDTLPTDVTFVSATGGTITAAGNVITVNVGTLASGESKTVTITVNVAQTAATTFTNNALVRSTESTAGFDSDTTNNADSEPTATQSLIDLAITKTDSADPIIPGQPLVYTIVVTNNGPSNATQVRVTDNLPNGIQITSATSTVGTVTIPASAQDTTPANNDDLIVNVGNLALGATATITVNATVLPGTTGTLTNVANVESLDTSLTETNTANNIATETTGLTPAIDLRISKVDSIDPAFAGGALTYTIVVTNDGPSTATNVTLSDTLPAGVTFTSVTSTQGTVSNAAGVVSGSLGTLAPNASATITLIVGVNVTTRGSITNTASVVADQTESNTQNNSASASTAINANVDLGITKTDSVDPVAAGGNLVYTLIVTNSGPATATGVVVTDNLPTGLSFVSGSSTVGTVSNVGNAVTVNVGTLATGATATVTLNTTVASTTTGTISNTATVTSSENDTNTTNNSATQPTTLAVPGSISGFVYLDLNRNGVRDTGDTGVANVVLNLTGTDMTGAAITRQATTDTNGAYTFGNLLPGTYQIVETQPEGLGDGQTNVGTGATGVAGTNQITTIVLGSGANAQAFDFGEVRAEMSKRRFLASSSPTA